jgi:hypothetical protein
VEERDFELARLLDAWLDSAGMLLDALADAGLCFWQADNGLWYWKWGSLSAEWGVKTVSNCLKDAIVDRYGLAPAEVARPAAA